MPNLFSAALSPLPVSAHEENLAGRCFLSVFHSHVIAHYWQVFLLILKTPFLHTDLIWGIVPLYFGWLLNEMTSSKASFRTAVQTGFTFVWAAAQWLFQYAHKRPVG